VGSFSTEGGDDATASRFAGIRDAFERAWRRAGAARRHGHYRLLGAPVRVRIAGSTLADHIEAPFAHLREEATAAPVLRIDLWDAGETGVAGPVDAARHAAGRAWTLTDGSFAVSGDARMASHELGDSVTWLDRRAGHLVGWFGDGRRLSLHQRAKPVQMLLALWADDRGLQAVHAALVARAGDAVLIPGNSGSGKTTIALACLEAGYGYLGDDWAGVAPAADGSVAAHGLYGSALLDPAHAARFPHLMPHAIPPQDPSEPKSLLLLPRLFPGRLAGAAAVRALALPRVVGCQPAGWRRASKRDALLMLAPSSVFTMRPRSGRQGVERLAALAERLPAYWLDVNDDLAAIARHVAAILADAAR
jgi:hypothetical protein